MRRLAAAFGSLQVRLESEEAKRKKLETLRDDLTNMLIHDLKHPITVLGTAVALIEDEGWLQAGEKKRASLVAMIKKSLARGNAMIEELLQMGRLEQADIPVERKRIPLRPLLEECAKTNALITEQSGRTWRLDIDPGIQGSWVYVDPALFKRAVGNLVLNAIEHTPPGGQVTLGACLSGRDGSKVQIYVRDEGSGIPAQMGQAIFKKYVSFTDSAKNVGLGLAFCKMVAERHSGRIEARSLEEGGAQFSLELPASAPAFSVDPLTGAPEMHPSPN